VLSSRKKFPLRSPSPKNYVGEEAGYSKLRIVTCDERKLMVDLEENTIIESFFGSCISK